MTGTHDKRELVLIYIFYFQYGIKINTITMPQKKLIVIDDVKRKSLIPTAYTDSQCAGIAGTAAQTADRL